MDILQEYLEIWNQHNIICNKVKQYINEGKDAIQISKRMHISEQEVYRIVESLFFSNIYVYKLKENETRNYKGAIVVDTCALGNRQGLEIIKNASKIIILETTLKEMDNVSKKIMEKGDFATLYEIGLRWNISEFIKKASKDIEEKKYITVKNKNVSFYNDTNLLWFCRNRRGCIMLTEDRKLNLRARSEGIKAILVEKKNRSKQQKETLSKVVTDVEQRSTETTEPNQKRIEATEVIPKILVRKESLSIDLTSWRNKGYMIERKGTLLSEDNVGKDKILNLEQNDIVYSVYQNNGELNIKKYIILDTKKTPYAKLQCEKNGVTCINELYRGELERELSEEVKINLKNRLIS